MSGLVHVTVPITHTLLHHQLPITITIPMLLSPSLFLHYSHTKLPPIPLSPPSPSHPHAFHSLSQSLVLSLCHLRHPLLFPSSLSLTFSSSLLSSASSSLSSSSSSLFSLGILFLNSLCQSCFFPYDSQHLLPTSCSTSASQSHFDTVLN